MKENITETVNANGSISIFKNGELSAVNTGNFNHVSFTQRFCLTEFWEQDSNTSWTHAEELTRIANSPIKQTWEFTND